ncbi:hypothetical protein NC651_026701 [Populus alba x Populus x berolinensis]|nr:hypothetical protein NC651_026701 [Populus alba x Populus x berolinensis]
MILKLVTALKQIDKRLTQGGQPFELGGACSQDSEANSTSVCNCTLNLNNDSYCHITSLSLKTLNFQGKLPSEMVNLTYLKYLSLTSNRLSGNIPGYLGSFRSLTYLSLEANQFSGTIPSQLGDLVNLTDLILSSNQLEGTLPKTLAKLNLTNLRITDMSGPEFNLPNIPPRVKTLVLRNINLTGVIPTDVWTMASLTTLDLTFNKLEGEIPRNAKTRKLMFLSGNKLNGSVPDSFLKTDKNIDVSYNNFSWLPSCRDTRGINTYRSSLIKNNL